MSTKPETHGEQSKTADVWFESTGRYYLANGHLESALKAAFIDGMAEDGKAVGEVVDMVLYCPKCGTQHIDSPEIPANELFLYTEENGIKRPVLKPARVTPPWTNPPHKSHLCHGCGHIWRPSDTPTNGVERTASGKDADTRPQPAAQVAQPLTDAELELCRQWFDNVQDINAVYLERADYVLAEKLYQHLGMRVTNSIKAGIGKDQTS